MRVGLVGAGRTGEVHLRTLTRNPVVSQVRLHDPDAARAEVLCRTPGAVVAPDVDVLLAEVDALALLDRALERQLPTFCEKPVVRPSAVADFRDRFAAAYRAALDAFLVLVAGRAPNRCDLFEALRTPRLVVAAPTALRERRVVSLTDLPATTVAGHVNESGAS